MGKEKFRVYCIVTPTPQNDTYCVDTHTTVRCFSGIIPAVEVWKDCRWRGVPQNHTSFHKEAEKCAKNFIATST
jgi:hypothetical protein